MFFLFGFSYCDSQYTYRCLFLVQFKLSQHVDTKPFFIDYIFIIFMFHQCYWACYIKSLGVVLILIQSFRVFFWLSFLHGTSLCSIGSDISCWNFSKLHLKTVLCTYLDKFHYSDCHYLGHLSWMRIPRDFELFSILVGLIISFCIIIFRQMLRRATRRHWTRTMWFHKSWGYFPPSSLRRH